MCRNSSFPVKTLDVYNNIKQNYLLDEIFIKKIKINILLSNYYNIWIID